MNDIEVVIPPLFFSRNLNRKDQNDLFMENKNINFKHCKLINFKIIPNLYKKVLLKIEKDDIILKYKVYVETNNIDCTIKQNKLKHFDIDYDPIDHISIKPLFQSIKDQKECNEILKEIEFIYELKEIIKETTNELKEKL